MRLVKRHQLLHTFIIIFDKKIITCKLLIYFLSNLVKLKQSKLLSCHNNAD